MSSNRETLQNEESTMTEKASDHDDHEVDREAGPPPFELDEKETYFPVFFLVDEPAEYGEAMNNAICEFGPWVDITSESPANVLQEIKSNLAATSETSPRPFLNCTVAQVYEFFKQNLRPADDDPKGSSHIFSYFTFLAVDEECLKSEPWQCILCCDAPDYGEGHSEVKLKQLRMPIPKAMDGLSLLETLVQTPSEFLGNPAFVLGMVPGGWLVHTYDEHGNRRQELVCASPGRARRKKRQSIEDVEESARRQKAEEESAERGEL